MTILERLLKRKNFREAAELIKKLAEENREATEGGEYCYRVIASPMTEIPLWEVYKGYSVKDSYWGRFVCSSNKYLGWLTKRNLLGTLMPGSYLHTPLVLIKVKSRGKIRCIEYTKAVLESFPCRIKDDVCTEAEDAYVSPMDILLSECYSNEDISIKDIVKIYVDDEFLDSPEVQKAIEFAKKYNIPIEYGIPEPE